MKRVLILGAGSYIGGAFEAYLKERPDRYRVTVMDMRAAWREESFAGFDTALMVAGIAHLSTARMDAQAADAYWQVNALLPFEAASKARQEGVRQFIFFSSMSVYGRDGRLDGPEVIGKDTPPAPSTLYGRSKLEAEQRLSRLAGGDFSIAILRPPMIYGPNCRGNYPLLSKAARKLPFFPDLGNRRSMLYIGTLCLSLQALVDAGAGGLFFPRNKEDVDVAQLVRLIADAHGRRIALTRALNAPIRLLGRRVGVLKKVFGWLTYDAALPSGAADGEETALEESVRLTEGIRP